MAHSSASEPRKFRGFRNRLGLERSPYLLQHANNPVDWYVMPVQYELFKLSVKTFFTKLTVFCTAAVADSYVVCVCYIATFFWNVFFY